MKNGNENTMVRDDVLSKVPGGTIINRKELEDFIKRMKAAGYSKAAAVGTVTTFPEAGSFSTDPWADIQELNALASDIYDNA